MGEDGNTIEIRIDAADTLAAAESASDSNKKLQQFKAALDLFSQYVDNLTVTTLETADVLKDLSNLFADLPQRLKERIELMHEQVLSNVEPILEKNINDMTARVIERVCGSVQGPEASRTAVQTADGKVPSTQAVSPPPSVVTAKQPDEFKRPDAMIQHVFGGVGSTISDAITGAATNTRQERSRTEATRFQSWEEEINGETIQFRETIKDISNSVSKVVTKSTGFYGVEQKLTPEQKKVQQQFGFLEQPIGKRDIELSDKGVHRAMGALPKDVGENFVDGFRDAMEPFFAEREDAADHYRKQTEQLNRQALSNWKKPNAFSGIDVEDLTKYNKEMRDIVPIFKEAKKVEHDRAAAIRKEITGALIAVHVMKVTAQGSQVFSAGLQIVNAGFSHLLNNLMLPMMPMFIIIGQSLHWLANVVAMLPMPIRQLIGFLMIWKATSMLVSAMPIKEVLAGMKEMFATLRGGGNVLGTFVKLVKAFVNFMNSGIGSGGGGAAVLGGIKGTGGFIKNIGKRALGRRALGGPVKDGEPYLVGEKGPEIYVPTRHGHDWEKEMLRRNADMLSSQFPSAAERLDQITYTAEGYKSAYHGLYFPNPSVIALDRDKYGLSPEDEEWNQRIRDFTTRAGFHPPGTEHKSATLWHEFGHHIEEMIRKGVYGDDIKREFDDLSNGNLDRSTVSEYATSPGTGDYDEGFAEAFTAHYFSPNELSEKSPYLRKVSELLDKIKFRALGGPVWGDGAYVVGEKGPELFVPEKSGTIIPNDVLSQIPGKAKREAGGPVTVPGGTSITMNEGGGFTGPVTPTASDPAPADPMVPFGGDPWGALGAGLGVGGLAWLLTGSPLLAAGLGVGAGILGPEGIADLIAGIVSSDLGQDLIASINVISGMISAILAPLAPIMGVMGVVLGAVTGSRLGGGGGDGGRTAETVYRVGTEQLKATGKMNVGVQSSVGLGARAVNRILTMILLRLGSCLLVTPCVPFAFFPEVVITGVATIIATLGDILAALSVLPEAILERIKIVVDEIVAKIKYEIETVGEVPTVEDITAKITYEIETVGTVPDATDRTAKLSYEITTIGELPPDEIFIDATIKPKFEELPEPPKVEMIGEIKEYDLLAPPDEVTIDTALLDITKEEYRLLKENVERMALEDPVTAYAKIIATLDPKQTRDAIDYTLQQIGEIQLAIDRLDLTDDSIIELQRELDELRFDLNNLMGHLKDVTPPAEEPEITVRALVNGEPEFTFNQPVRIYSVADITSADTSNLAPVGLPVDPYIPDGTTLSLPEGTAGKIPVEPYIPPGSVVELPKGTSVKLPAVIDADQFNPGPDWEQIGENTYRWKGRMSAGATFTLESEFNPGPEWEKIGENLWRRRNPLEVPTEPIISEGFSWTKFFENLKGGAKEGAKTGLGGAIGFFILDGIREYLSKGTINFGDLFNRSIIALVAGGVIRMFAGAIVAEVVMWIGAGVLVHEVKGLFDPLMQRWLDSWDASGFLGNVFSRILSPENNQMVSSIFGPVFGGVFTGIVDTALDFISKQNFAQKLKDAFMKAGLGGLLNIGSAMSIILDPSTTLTQKLEAFNNMFKQTVDGGIPVNVAIDIDSVTSVVEAIRETAGGTPISGGASTPDEVVQECQPGYYWDRALQQCAPIQGSVIPSHAFGGTVLPNIPTLVGERGPEMVIPTTAGSVITNNDLGRALGGGGGQSQNVTINQTFNVTTNNPRELTDTVMRELKLELARVKM